MAKDLSNRAAGKPLALDLADLDAVTGGTITVNAKGAWYDPNASETTYGLGGNDDLDGNGGKDFLDGGAGHDTLEGGKGDDTMRGGYGSDTFIINLGDGNDVVQGQRDTRAGETLTAGDVDKIVINGVDWDQVRIVFTKGDFSSEAGPDGTRKLETNSAGTIHLPDGQTIQFRGIERIQLPHDR
jgi:Ca2+-binding RTX toxin-like protein